MSESVKNLWYFFFAFLTFGLWTIPILIVLVGVAIFIEYRWPDFYEKYLR